MAVAFFSSPFFISLQTFSIRVFFALPYAGSYGLFFYFATLIFCPFFQQNSFVGLDHYFSFYDSFSVLLILLTAGLMPVCMYLGRSFSNYRLYTWIFFFIELCLVGCFLTHDILLFYVCFEMVSILMFVIILYWGYEVRRSLASYYFFYFTFLSSLFFLSGIVLIYLYYSTFNWYDLVELQFSTDQQCLLWWLFFAAFAVKIPMFPFHVWLPEAHVEAPTGGSILLAAVLLKLGFYGMYRFSFPLFYWASQYFSIFVYSLALLSIYHSMFVALRQIDAKRIVAYSSVAHMNFAVLGLFNATSEGVLGSVFLMLGHGLVSSALFFLIGVLYTRYNTRSLFYYGGLLRFMPLFSFFLFLFILANISFPFTLSFIAEFLVLVSISIKSKLLFLLLVPPLLLNLVNSLFLFVRIAHGAFSATKLKYFLDLTYFEFYVLVGLLLITVLLGVIPNVALDYVRDQSMFWFGG